MDATQFGQYQLVELLGRGGMGEVWKAFDPVTDRMVALKVLPAHLAENEEFKQRFRGEAHKAAGFHNPHVIPIHTYGEIDGRLFVDMALIDGRDLEAVLAEGPLPPVRAVRIIEQVAKALHAAHKFGLVHRDVKPSNILLDDDDNAYLIDFGIARAADETHVTKGVIGTWHYMAPERFSSRDADARADIYALACVLYKCLTGRRPFPGDSMEQQYGGHVATPPPRPSTTQPTVPAAFDDVIATGMAKDPDERFATTVELARAARDAITTPIPQPVPAVAPPPAVPIPAPVAPPTVADRQSEAPAVGVSPWAPTQHAKPHNAAPPLAEPDRPPSPSTRPWWRRRSVLVSAVVLSVVAVIVAVTLAVSGNQRGPTQTVLPFTGLDHPQGVAVDTAGTIYVTNLKNNRVVMLAAGSTTQTVVPFTGLSTAVGVAVDTAGSVYVTDSNNNRVVQLAAGSNTQIVPPFTGLDFPNGVAVDRAGSVYVTDDGNDRVVMLAAGSTTPTVLPFTGLEYPQGVAVDSAGSVYVTDGGNGRVVKLAAGSTTQTVLPFTGLNYPRGVAVDTTGSVYVSDGGNHRVVKMAAGSTTQTVLAFTGLFEPQGVAVDTAGNVYVANRVNNRVLKLAPG